MLLSKSLFLFVVCLTDKPIVAFSASLFGHGGQTVGGYTHEEILKFKKVFTNIGDGYSHTTGTICFIGHSISEKKPSCSNFTKFSYLIQLKPKYAANISVKLLVFRDELRI